MKKRTICHTVTFNMADENFQKKSRKRPLFLRQENCQSKRLKNIPAYTIKQITPTRHMMSSEILGNLCHLLQNLIMLSLNIICFIEVIFELRIKVKRQWLCFTTTSKISYQDLEAATNTESSSFKGCITKSLFENLKKEYSKEK